MPDKKYLPQHVLSRAEAAIELVMNEGSSVRAVVISTEDGFELVSRVDNNAQVTRLSAMASSLSALGVLAGEESNLGECKNIIIEAASGMLIILQFKRGQDTFIMSVIAGTDAVIGQILYFAKQAVRTLQVME